MSHATPRIGLVSLGCPKALVDSERIMTRLATEGYGCSADYQGADLVIVNTCGFLNSARVESLEAIGEAIAENGRVIVTGCLGALPELVRNIHPKVAAITGPHQYEAVVNAVHQIIPPPVQPRGSCPPAHGLRFTPPHYAYLKIAEGCDNRCTFCLIPALRGPQTSRRIDDVLLEAESLVEAGVKELIVVSQDTTAYGRDIGHAAAPWRGRTRRSRLPDLMEALGELGVWVRLMYAYPGNELDSVLPLMTEGKILPYLDMPLQHASPQVLKAMRRPAARDRTLERITRWRELCPELSLRSTFIVGFPGETDADVACLLDFLEQARLDRVGCFVFEAVEGVSAATFPDAIPETVAIARQQTFMQTQEQISRDIMNTHVGKVLQVLVDSVSGDSAVGRARFDAPEIDGSVLISRGLSLSVGAMTNVRITAAGAYDLKGVPENVPKKRRIGPPPGRGARKRKG